MTEGEILALKRFVQEITERPRPLETQPVRREGVFLWCEDWEIIEIVKCLFHGEPAYRGDPPPRRLRHNPLWSQDAIVQQAEALVQEHGTAERIIEVLRARRAGAVHV